MGMVLWQSFFQPVSHSMQGPSNNTSKLFTNFVGTQEVWLVGRMWVNTVAGWRILMGCLLGVWVTVGLGKGMTGCRWSEVKLYQVGTVCGTCEVGV